ncbi:MAG: XRE family transcriptional regulator [Terriglobales bacterium]
MVKDFRSLQERLRQRLLAEIAAGELTGLELARRTGFQQAHISNFLNRKRGLSLEAMDEILRARGLSISELLRSSETKPSRPKTIHAADGGMQLIPLIATENCLASDVPLAGVRDTLQVMTSRLEKLPARMHTPRAHWQRFVAIRVGPPDADAMGPRLTRGAVVVIDRHSNEVAAGAIYLVRLERKIVLRYVERVGEAVVARAENTAYPLERVESEAAIVGRVCLVITEI